MAVSSETTFLSPAALDAAAALQTRAFFDDPLFEFVFSEAAARRDRLPWIMRVSLALGMRFGEVHTTSPSMLGHAAWLPPGGRHVTPQRLTEVGFVDAAQYMGEQSLDRFGAFMDEVAPIHERLVPEPHWYLMVLGVDPPYQGRGVGGTLIQPILLRADSERRRCYLETAKERNLAFYRKHGFEVAAEDDIGESGPHVWMMMREPRGEAGR